MLTFFTTTNSPPWVFTVLDPNTGQALANFSSATFIIYFVNVSNNQKYQGSGVWTITDVSHGVFQYQLDDADLATAYATQSSSPGLAIFDICVEVRIGTKKYDPMSSRIAIRKI